jgi:altronate hydrolase/altronate dehydratase small subunit
MAIRRRIRDNAVGWAILPVFCRRPKAMTGKIAHPTMSLALCVHRDDNVATLLEDAAQGPITLLGETSASYATATEAVSRGHKIALSPLSAGAAVMKYGVTIGHATSDIPAGAWVHTHNCASSLDARSATLDRHTGAPTDTTYE